MLDWLNEAADAETPVVLNAGGVVTHYSYALRDACAQLTAPLVEVHLSDPHARRSSGTLGGLAVATGVIAGLGVESTPLRPDLAGQWRPQRAIGAARPAALEADSRRCSGPAARGTHHPGCVSCPC